MISRRHRRIIWVPIQSRWVWVKSWILVTATPFSISIVRTCFPEAEGIVSGTTKTGSSARRERNFEAPSASRM